MKWEPPINQDANCRERIISLILDHSENMLILAYELTHNATRANKIVENIFLDVYLQNNLPEHITPLHTWLYDLVKESCEDSPIPTE